MKKDPNKCCIIYEENIMWALIHDVFAHPLMGLTGYSLLSQRFHDYTSARAWRRND
jgi:hypothetical protein